MGYLWRWCYAAAQHAEVFGAKRSGWRERRTEAIKPMKAAFDRTGKVKRLHGTHVKQAATRWEMAEQIRQDIRDTKLLTIVTVVVIWLQVLKYIFLCVMNISHWRLSKKAMKENNTEKRSKHVLCDAAYCRRCPYIIGVLTCVVMPAMGVCCTKNAYLR